MCCLLLLVLIMGWALHPQDYEKELARLKLQVNSDPPES